MSLCFSEKAGWGWGWSQTSETKMNDVDVDDEKDLYNNDRFPMWQPNEYADHLEYNGPSTISNEQENEFVNLCVDSRTLFIRNVFEAQSKRTTHGRTWTHEITATDQDFTKRVWELTQSQVILGYMIADGILPIHMQ